MISKDLTVEDRLVAAQFHECILEFFSTQQSNLWLLQLRHDSSGNCAFTLHEDNFAAFCVGLKQCIDSAVARQSHPTADMMVNIIAQDLETSASSHGGISIVSNWSEEPNVQFNFYPDQNNRKSRITLIYMLQDAMELYNRFAVAYNQRGQTPD